MLRMTSTVNVPNPNVRILVNAEIRTIDRLVNRRSDFERSVRFRSFERSDFGVYSIKYSHLSEYRAFERPCSAFGHKFVSEIRTNRSDFGRFRSFELYLNRIESLCLKSERVRISDVYCTVVSNSD